MTSRTINTISSKQTYPFAFTFEEGFSPDRARKWMMENRWKGFLFCGVYVFLIFFLKFYMINKPRYELRKSLALWSGFLSIFSIIGTIRLLPRSLDVLLNGGLYDSICSLNSAESSIVSEFWTWLFVLSKLLELGDTVFVVLRKQPLKFLHWYHHVTVLLYSWYAYSDNDAYVRWFSTVNFTVHAFMYSYYTLRALGVFVPKFVMVIITLMQIAQMVMGCAINCMAYFYIFGEKRCLISQRNLICSSLMYFSYLVLFSRFFYKSYISPPQKQKYSSISGHQIKSK